MVLSAHGLEGVYSLPADIRRNISRSVGDIVLELPLGSRRSIIQSLGSIVINRNS